jgi:hypothetical protein
VSLIVHLGGARTGERSEVYQTPRSCAALLLILVGIAAIGSLVGK